MSEVSAWLPDVNVLIALMDPCHVSPRTHHSWWRGQPGRLWATCAITENGLIRVLAQPRYPNNLATVAEAVGLLRRWKATHASTHFPGQGWLAVWGVALIVLSLFAYFSN